jgi:hypothetical protein
MENEKHQVRGSRRNHIAKELRSPKYRQRVVIDRKKYNRKKERKYEYQSEDE